MRVIALFALVAFLIGCGPAAPAAQPAPAKQEPAQPAAAAPQ